jgi:hypothetical protein
MSNYERGHFRRSKTLSRYKEMIKLQTIAIYRVKLVLVLSAFYPPLNERERGWVALVILQNKLALIVKVA